MGGGGITSLKDLIIESNTNIIKDGDYTITYSASSNYNVSFSRQPYEATNRNYNVNSDWMSDHYLPQWWQVDLGRIEHNICKFSFASAQLTFNDDIGCKKYELSYSLDGLNFNKIYSGIYPASKPPNFRKYYNPTYCDFNDISARYFRITILSVYGNGNVAAIIAARLYARMVYLYLKKSDNNIYGSVNNEITQITTLDTWNNSSKEEKKNFFSFTNGILSIDQLKSLGKFKVLNEPKN